MSASSRVEDDRLMTGPDWTTTVSHDPADLDIVPGRVA
jgi:hypothetical protein